MSAGIAMTSALVSFRIAFAASSSVRAFRAQMATLHPSRAKANAAARPSPWLAAATRATLPRSPRSMGRNRCGSQEGFAPADSLADETPDLADRLEAHGLVQLLGSVEHFRGQHHPFAPGAGCATAGLEDHRPGNASEAEIGGGRDIVDPRERTSSPHANRPSRRPVHVCHKRPHPAPLRPVMQDAPNRLDHPRGVAESCVGGDLQEPEVIRGSAFRCGTNLDLRIHDARRESHLRHGQIGNRSEPLAGHVLLHRASLLYILEEERPMPDDGAAERVVEVSQDLCGAPVGYRGDPAEVRLGDGRESFVPIDRTPGGRDPGGSLLAPHSQELDDRAKQLVRVHRGSKGPGGMNLAAHRHRYFRPPRRTPLYYGPMPIIEARNSHASGTRILCGKNWRPMAMTSTG